MKILVTGGKGYIGTNFHCNFAGRPEPELITSYDLADNQDIRNPELLDTYVNRYDVVVHLAALPGIVACNKNPLIATDINLIGTINILKSCRKHGIQMIFASSMAAMNPGNFYGSLKRAGELVCNSYEKATVVRISNVYGGLNYLKKTTVVANWMSAAKNGDPLKVFGDISQRRDFIHVDDVCNGIMLAIKTKPKVFNACTGRLTSLHKVLKIFRDTIPVNVDYLPPREGDVAKISPMRPSFPHDYKFVSMSNTIREFFE